MKLESSFDFAILCFAILAYFLSLGRLLLLLTSSAIFDSMTSVTGSYPKRCCFANDTHLSQLKLCMSSEETVTVGPSFEEAFQPNPPEDILSFPTGESIPWKIWRNSVVISVS